MTEKHDEPTSIEVADAILKEDVVGRNQTVDRHGAMGQTREYLRYRLRRLAGLDSKKAKELSKQGLSDFPEEKIADARGMLLEMIETGETMQGAGFTGSEMSLMRGVIANAHGHNDGTTISA